MYTHVLAESKHQDSSLTTLGHLEFCLPHSSCMCVSCQRGRTAMKFLYEKACGPLTSGCQRLQTCLGTYQNRPASESDKMMT